MRIPIDEQLPVFDIRARRHQQIRWLSGHANQCYSGHVHQFSRITTNPGVMGGKPCIRGMRVRSA